MITNCCFFLSFQILDKWSLSTFRTLHSSYWIFFTRFFVLCSLMWVCMSVCAPHECRSPLRLNESIKYPGTGALLQDSIFLLPAYALTYIPKNRLLLFSPCLYLCSWGFRLFSWFPSNSVGPWFWFSKINSAAYSLLRKSVWTWNLQLKHSTLMIAFI